MKTSDTRKDSLGRVMVELILVFPVMILVPCAIFEICNFMQYTQAASFASGQAALLANRQCADFFSLTVQTGGMAFDRTSSARRTQDCLNASALQTLAVQARQYLPSDGFTLVVSVYRFNSDEDSDTANATLERVGQWLYPTTELDSNKDQKLRVQTQFAVVNGHIEHASGGRYPKADGQVLVSQQDVQGRRRLVVSELSYHYRPRTPIISWLYTSLAGGEGTSRRFYREVTVL
jgi:hypothetical protein